jgi:signal peptidase I
VPPAAPTPPPRRPQDDAAAQRKQEARERVRSIVSTIAVLLIAPIVAVLLTMFVFQSYQVSGQSMEPTLHNADRLIIWKLPKTWAKVTGNPYVPHRGDIVVLNDAKLAEFGDNPKQQIIKRVIALPGERVVIKDNTLTVYNSEHPEGFNPDKTMEYGKILNTVTDGNIDRTIPEDNVFVLGDNRPHSLDSRSLGPIPVKDIAGKLTVRVLPVDQMDRF